MTMKQYGIRVTLPEGDPMRSSHLLGDNFEMFRWFDNPEERDAAYEEMRRRIPFYRAADVVSQVVEKVERNAG